MTVHFTFLRQLFLPWANGSRLKLIHVISHPLSFISSLLPSVSVLSIHLWLSSVSLSLSKRELCVTLIQSLAIYLSSFIFLHLCTPPHRSFPLFPSAAVE